MVLYIIKAFCFFRRRDSLSQLRVERRWFVPQRKYVIDKPLPNKGFQWASTTCSSRFPRSAMKIAEKATAILVDNLVLSTELIINNYSLKSR